ncbi:hypothetical protein [uncultured Microbacterium sp.]|uniref:RCC1 domain-containing protein n=1 Tax=uncultured Microbacterium sp. TaxID=191216 RepID=UPI0025CE785A|nr:hypothetical protein [uncultured Microbacterium sp.]
MNRSRLALASLLLLVVGFGGTMSSTSASFTASASTPANSIATGALEDAQPNADPVTDDSATLTWNAAPTGGATPTYSVTRSDGDGSDPTTIYTGADTTYTDLGGIPAELTSRDIIAVSTGTFHSLALDSDHHVYAWGNNVYGQLGTGDMTYRSTPTPISFPDGVIIVSVIAGGYQSFAIDTDHHVYAWGNNSSGQLGTGDQTNRSTPTPITLPDGVTITTLVAGSYHSLALDTDHRVYAWGNNNSGQLGTGDKTDRPTPTPVTFPAGITTTTLVAGSYHSLALDTDHRVYAWGNNSSRQLGTGNTTAQSTPTSLDMTSRACPTRSILLADGTTCSLRSNQAYRYTVTTTVGGWTYTSVPLSVSTPTQ